VRRTILIAVAVALALLVGAAPASAATVFADGFESGDFSAWSNVQTAGDGTAAIESAIVRTGALAAQLSESATAGSKAYVRKTFNAAQQDVTASGDFRVLKEGASGGNVPFFRVLDPASARLVSVYRQNSTGVIGLTFANGTHASTTAKLALDTWATVALHVITNGASSTVEVRVNGTLVYQSSAQSLGTAGVSTLQIGNDTAAQAFTLVADTIAVDNSAPATPSPPINTVKPTISGTPQEGQQLTAADGNWDGTQPITFTRQWQRCDASGAACADVAGATASTYAVTSADVGATLRVVVTATNSAGSATAASAATAVVQSASAPPVNTSPPTVSGTAQVDQALTAGPGSWTGTQPIAFAYQWERCDSAGGICVDIAGATGATYTVTSTDVGSTLRVVVTASNAAGTSAPAASNITAVVKTAPAPPGLVALWHMDETSGTVMHDAVGGHDGTLQNVVLGQPGFAGLAYGFTGSSQVLVPSAADLNPGAANVTLTIHLKATSVPATPDWDLLRKGVFASAGGEYKVEYQPSGQATCGFNTSTNYAELTAGPALDDGQWHTVQCVKTANGVQVVVDGHAFSKAASLGTIANSDQVAVGAHPNAEFFRGSLDEASVQVG
jgi:hypothetical protein